MICFSVFTCNDCRSWISPERIWALIILNQVWKMSHIQTVYVLFQTNRCIQTLSCTCVNLCESQTTLFWRCEARQVVLVAWPLKAQLQISGYWISVAVECCCIYYEQLLIVATLYCPSEPHTQCLCALKYSKLINCLSTSRNIWSPF